MVIGILHNLVLLPEMLLQDLWVVQQNPLAEHLEEELQGNWILVDF